MQLIKFVCKECKNRFEANIGDHHDIKEDIKQGRSIIQVKCPKCQSKNIKRG